jgi:hypothetical protein
MLVGLMVITGAVLCAALASYVMWWSTSRSGLWSLTAGAVLAIAAFVCAIVIGWLITRATFPN